MSFPYYATITDADLPALVAYLRSLPPLPEEPRSVTDAAAAWVRRGRGGRGRL